MINTNGTVILFTIKNDKNNYKFERYLTFNIPSQKVKIPITKGESIDLYDGVTPNSLRIKIFNKIKMSPEHLIKESICTKCKENKWENLLK